MRSSNANPGEIAGNARQGIETARQPRRGAAQKAFRDTVYAPVPDCFQCREVRIAVHDFGSVLLGLYAAPRYDDGVRVG